MPVSVTIQRIERSMLPEVADLHFQVFDGPLNTRIGRRYVYHFIEWFTQSSDAIALAALSHGAVAGYVVGAPLGYQPRMTRELLFVGAWGMLSHPWVLFNSRFIRRICFQLRNLIGVETKGWVAPALPPPTMMLVKIAVSPNMQGRKIGYRLMEAFEFEAQNRGMKSLILTVRKANSVATTLYAGRGWVTCPECGLSLDWDHNAAINILNRGLQALGTNTNRDGQSLWALSTLKSEVFAQEAAGF